MKTLSKRIMLICTALFISFSVFSIYIQYTSILEKKLKRLIDLDQITQSNEDGIIMSGAINEKYEGYGVIINNTNKTLLYAEFSNDSISGLSVKISPKTLSIDEYRHDKCNGKSITFDLESEVCILGQYINNKKNGDFYIYDLDDGYYNGYSTFKNDKHIGDVEEHDVNLKYNKGTAYAFRLYPSENIYAGEVNIVDEYDGLGYYYWENSGNQYGGYFSNNKPHGVGVLIYYNHDAYVGRFINGKRHGVGYYFYKDNKRYVGEWKNDKKYGKGSLISEDCEIIYTGYWDNDKYIGKEAPSDYKDFDYFDANETKKNAPRFVYNY